MYTDTKDAEGDWEGVWSARTTMPADCREHWTWTDGSPYGVDILAETDVGGYLSGCPCTEMFANAATPTAPGKGCARWGWSGKYVWDVVGCDETKPFACKVEIGPPSSPPPPCRRRPHVVAATSLSAAARAVAILPRPGAACKRC